VRRVVFIGGIGKIMGGVFEGKGLVFIYLERLGNMYYI
jgi:hypothetical protein